MHLKVYIINNTIQNNEIGTLQKLNTLSKLRAVDKKSVGHVYHCLVLREDKSVSMK